MNYPESVHGTPGLLLAAPGERGGGREGNSGRLHALTPHACIRRLVHAGSPVDSVLPSGRVPSGAGR